MSTICVDSGFLIGLYDESDQHHGQAREHFSTYFDKDFNQLLIPWPILYETITTRMVRRKNSIAALDRDWRILQARRQLVFLDDQEFRRDAMDDCLAEVHRPGEHYRPMSLTDRVIRYILEKVNIKIDTLITFNPRDFVDVCRKLHRNLIS